jgi:2-dehydropantoate 2-reductase
MRFHCLGLGSIGTLLAFHLQRVAKPQHSISLLVRRGKITKKSLSQAEHRLVVEKDGVRRWAGGFDLEVTNTVSESLYQLLYDEKGMLRVPTTDPSRFKTPLPFEKESKKSTLPPDPNAPPPPGGPIDSLIVTTKATNTLPAIAQIRSRLSPSSTIVLCQNGMGIYEALVSGVFPDPEDRPNFILATTTHGAWTKDPFDIVHASSGTISFGIVPDPRGKRDFERSSRTPEGTLSLTDIITPTESSTSSETKRYSSLETTLRVLLSISELSPSWQPVSKLQNTLLNKLVINCCINPLTALLNCRNGQLFGNPPAHRLMVGICGEAAAVLKAHWQNNPATDSNTLGPPPTAAALELQVLRVARSTAANYSSMLWDVRKGKPTEIEFMNGYLSRLGQQYGVKTPCNDTLVDLIRLKRTIPPSKL